MTTRHRSLSTVSALLIGVGSLCVGAATATAAPHALAAPVGPAHPRGHAVAHVFISSLGFPGFTNGWKWSSEHDTDSAGFDATRNGVGDYTIRFNGIGFAGNAQLVPWTKDTTRRPPICTIADVTPVKQGVEVDVRCFDAMTGRAREGDQFDVWFTSERTTGVEDFVYMTSSVAAPASPTTVPATGYFSAGTVAPRPTVRLLSTGVYDVHIKHSMEGGWPRVTAMGTRARWCNPTRFEPDRNAGMHVRVACFGPSGTPRNSAFSLNVTAFDPLTGLVSYGADLRIVEPASAGTNTPTFDNSNTATDTPSNKHTRNGVGDQSTEMPEVRRTVPSAWVQAWTGSARRCLAVAHLGSAIDAGLAGVRTLCMRAGGTRTDTRLTVSRWDRPEVDLTAPV